MIYILCVTQILTVTGALVGVWWVKEYFEKQTEASNHERGLVMQHAKEVTLASQECVKQAIESSQAQLQTVLDKSFRDREILLERIQHPEYMKAQAHSAPGHEKAVPTTVDEISEWEREHPDETWERSDLTAMIPGARLEDAELTPVPSVQPFGKGRSHGTTE